MTPEALTTEGVLCQLKMGRWDASVRIPKEKLPKDLPKEIVRATNDVLEDRTILKDLATIRRMSKGFLSRRSLPFPVDGVFWVDKKHVPEIDEKFREFQKEYFKRRDILKSNLGKEKAKFKAKYPKFYKEKYYPSADELDKKYYYRWNFFQMNVPAKELGVLTPKMIKQETEKLRGMVKEMEEMTVNLVGNMIYKRINKLAEQCDSGKINAGTFNSVERFLERWDDLWRDHVDEKKLRITIAHLKKHMKSATAEKLKGNDQFREMTGDKLEQIMKKIKAVPDFKLKRKLDV